MDCSQTGKGDGLAMAIWLCCLFERARAAFRSLDESSTQELKKVLVRAYIRDDPDS